MDFSCFHVLHFDNNNDIVSIEEWVTVGTDSAPLACSIHADSWKKGGVAMGTILDTAYNNYLTTYAPKELTRYDTHKKSELRSVYNSIVKLNKESPWYLPTTSKDTQTYAMNLKENARLLHNTIAQLGGLEEDGLFRKKSAYTTDRDVATASFIGTISESSESPEYQLEVESLATPQENLGNFLPDIRVHLPEDTYSFDVSINDMNYEFQFSIDSEETNREVQTRLARLINNAGIGLKAQVITDNNKTALRLISDSTGLKEGHDAIFSITDDNTSKRNGTVAYFGLDYTTRVATNACYTINGEAQSSTENRFQIGNMFQVRLHGTTTPENPVTIGLKTDIESLADNVSSLVNGYNDFIKATVSYQEQQSRSRRLLSEMRGIVSHYQAPLEELGIRMETDGQMSVDSSLLKQSAEESRDISQTFRILKDFSKSLLRKTDQVSIDPMEYVNRTVVAYKNPGKSFASPYTTSAYSGMMFNFFC